MRLLQLIGITLMIAALVKPSLLLGVVGVVVFFTKVTFKDGTEI